VHEILQNPPNETFCLHRLDLWSVLSARSIARSRGGRLPHFGNHISVGGISMSATLLEHEPASVPDWANDRARRGAAWLDSKFGPGWAEKIDATRLDIGSPSNCILGQLICQGHLSLIFVADGVDHGFSLGGRDLLVLFLPIAPLKRAYHPLNEAWRAILRERCGEAQTDLSTLTLASPGAHPQRAASNQPASIAASSRHTSA
jgi:hypothetical protein